MDYSEVLGFWFSELDPKQWFAKDSSLDDLIRTRFLGVHQRCSRCETFDWRETISGRLAEIIVLDQFSRNIFRGTPASFAWDPLALALAQEAIRSGQDKTLAPPEKAFLYMPFMHSESLEIHNVAVQLFSQPGLEYNLKYEEAHKVIIEQFGRYPHRNKVLNRKSTPEEIAFLKKNPGF